MSRIGKLPIKIPPGVSLSIDANQIHVNGTKGNLSQQLLEGINVVEKDGTITVSRVDDQAVHRANQGLMRALINNMVTGVSQGFVKKLEINGVGYRVQAQANGLKLSLGYSHDINVALPEGIKATIEQNVITLTGIDKQQVGQIASEIRALRKPEPYKGKGIRYEGESIIRKSGKSGKEK